MKGSRKAVLCFWDGSDEFGESTLPVCLQSQTPGISQAVPLSLRKNAKGGGQSAQLAFGSDKCRLSPNAFSRERRGNHARKIMRLSLEADRQLGGCAKEKFLYYIVVPGLAILHEIGDGDAVQVFVDDFVETLPERESFTASHSGAVSAAGL